MKTEYTWFDRYMLFIIFGSSFGQMIVEFLKAIL